MCVCVCYLQEGVCRQHVCVQVDVVGDVRERWRVVVGVQNLYRYGNRKTLLYAIGRRYLEGERGREREERKDIKQTKARKAK